MFTSHVDCTRVLTSRNFCKPILNEEKKNKQIPPKLILEMVPSSSAYNVTTRVACMFSWRMKSLKMFLKLLTLRIYVRKIRAVGLGICGKS